LQPPERVNPVRQERVAPALQSESGRDGHQDSGDAIGGAHAGALLRALGLGHMQCA